MRSYDARLKLTSPYTKSSSLIGYAGPYKGQWSEFEVQALAYSILRKHLYPTYLVRGEYQFPQCRIDIAIFKPSKSDESGNKGPVLVCVVEVKKTADGYDYSNQKQRYEKLLGVPCIYVKGGKEAYDILALVSSYLNPTEATADPSPQPLTDPNRS